MKFLRCVFVFFGVLLLFNNVCIDGFAMNTGISTEPMSQTNVQKLQENLKLSVLAEEPQRETIRCFDVNEHGLIAIGCENVKGRTVCIYTSDGEYQYGYQFQCMGSFGVELIEDLLIIYLVRGDIALAIDSGGEIINAVRLQETAESNSNWIRQVFSKERKTDEYVYVLKNDLGIFNTFASSYSQLIKIDKNNEEYIIYDVNTDQLLRVIISIIGVLCFAGVVILVLIDQTTKQKKT